MIPHMAAKGTGAAAGLVPTWVGTGVCTAIDWRTPAFGGVLKATNALEIPFVWDILNKTGVELWALPPRWLGKRSCIRHPGGPYCTFKMPEAGRSGSAQGLGHGLDDPTGRSLCFRLGRGLDHDPDEWLGSAGPEQNPAGVAQAGLHLGDLIPD
jgi:hypothetical protein